MTQRLLCDFIRTGSLATVRALVDDGAHIDMPDEHGRTPLMLACLFGSEEIARFLIERGAQIDLKEPQGRTALEFAMIGCHRLADVLVARGILGRTLRVPQAGGRLSPKECDVCIRYPDQFEPVDPCETPSLFAWLELVSERRIHEDRCYQVERSLRCPYCESRYHQTFRREVENLDLAPAVVFERVVRETPMRSRDATDPPSALLNALFVAEDGRLVCRIEGGPQGLLTTIWRGISGPAQISHAATQWRWPTNTLSENASERLGHLEVELGVVGAGELYTLYVVRRNPDGQLEDNKLWVSAEPDTPLDEIRLLPEYCSGPYAPYDWDWQDGWWYPYVTFRPATAAERALHERSSRLTGSP